jgi:hypothetical protein
VRELAGSRVEIGDLSDAQTSAPAAEVRELFRELLRALLEREPGARPECIEIRDETAAGPDSVTAIGVAAADLDCGVAAELLEESGPEPRRKWAGARGLAACRRRAERLGGALRAVPVLGGGTCFLLELPSPSGRDAGGRAAGRSGAVSNDWAPD